MKVCYNVNILSNMYIYRPVSGMVNSVNISRVLYHEEKKSYEHAMAGV